MSTQAIGVFDSGLGGLTVLRELVKTLPNESFVYLGDTARLPYGSKSSTTIHRYAKQNIDYLLKREVKAVVVACNSASAALRENPIDIDVPLLEVIGPGAQTAYKASAEKRIGVVGTWATVTQGAYSKALEQIDPSVEVFSQACPLLVPLVEEGWVDDPLTNLVIHRYLGPLLAHNIDTLILGCTHYPALSGAFRRVAGNAIHLVDSAAAISFQLKAAISRGDIVKNSSSQKGAYKLLTTDFGSRFQEISKRLLELEQAPDVEHIDL